MHFVVSFVVSQIVSAISRLGSEAMYRLTSLLFFFLVLFYQKKVYTCARSLLAQRVTRTHYGVAESSVLAFDHVLVLCSRFFILLVHFTCCVSSGLSTPLTFRYAFPHTYQWSSSFSLASHQALR